MEIFSDAWATAWRDAINQDEGYRTAGAAWDGPVLLRRSAGGDPGAFVELSGGRCHGARQALPGDDEAARIVIAAPEATWLQVLAGELDPVMGLVRGQLSLTKGSLLALMPHQAGARALLAAAVRVAQGPSGMPGDTPLRENVAAVGGREVAPRPPEPSPGIVSFQTTSGGGLNHGLFPMRLYHKAKKLGVWDPSAIDLARDAEDWKRLTDGERDLLLRLSALFQGGEEAVARDLLPLIQAVSDEGRLEEEMYLTTFLFEEAKHVEVFARFFAEVAPDHGDLTRFETPAYREIFMEELPRALHGLSDDRSPQAQARAAVTYNMIVEGVLAETGYRGYQATLEAHGILPGMQEAVRLVKRDESRHIAYGLYLLSRLTSAHGEDLGDFVDSELSRLVGPATRVVEEVFGAYDTVPFGLKVEDFTDFALQQFQARVRRLDGARRAGALVEDDA